MDFEDYDENEGEFMEDEDGHSLLLDEPYRARLSRLSSHTNIENRTPFLSQQQRHMTFSDRFIPTRSLNSADTGSMLRSVSPSNGRIENTETSPSNNRGANNGGLFGVLLRSELLGEDISASTTVAAALNNSGLLSSAASPPRSSTLPQSPPNSHTSVGAGGGAPATTPSVLRFRRSIHSGGTSGGAGPSFLGEAQDAASSPLSPLRSSTSRSLLQSPLVASGSRSRRKIPKAPFKVLDAPGLADDFYLNNVDWSARNVVSVGLGTSVYLWSAHTSKAHRLVDLAQLSDSQEEDVACVSFTEAGSVIAVGSKTGALHLLDTETGEVIRTYNKAHTGRVGCATWSGPILATGGRDKLVRERDTRVPGPDLIRDASVHRQEVCGLKYSFEGLAGSHRQLASGGNDNKLYIWDARKSGDRSGPLLRFSDHTAAVKALAWSPHQTGILASGGGTADRCIKVWSTITGTCVSSMDTGSQVCGLVYSKTVPELVSTHGYSLNKICVWRAQNPHALPLQKLTTLQGHTLRVLYLALSPDGSTVVTGAGDESLRFWSIWPGRASSSAGGSSKFGDMISLPNSPGAFLR